MGGDVCLSGLRERRLGCGLDLRSLLLATPLIDWIDTLCAQLPRRLGGVARFRKRDVVGAAKAHPPLATMLADIAVNPVAPLLGDDVQQQTVTVACAGL